MANSILKVKHNHPNDYFDTKGGLEKWVYSNDGGELWHFLSTESKAEQSFICFSEDGVLKGVLATQLLENSFENVATLRFFINAVITDKGCRKKSLSGQIIDECIAYFQRLRDDLLFDGYTTVNCDVECVPVSFLSVSFCEKLEREFIEKVQR